MYNDITYCYLFKNSVSPKDYILKRYVKFINNCKNINFNCYTETHHIIPRSFNGSNDSSNLIKLGARHHYVAHLLLARATGSPKMINALHRMVHSLKGDVQRNYKINSRVYAYLRKEHAKIVSNYSVVARQIYTEEIKRIPKSLFKEYNGILYEAIAKGRKDSQETKLKKQLASSRPRKVRQGVRSRSLAASKYSYETPLGFCENRADLLKLYPTFTKNTLSKLNGDAIISNKFASIHRDFLSYVGKTFKEYGIIKKVRK